MWINIFARQVTQYASTGINGLVCTDVRFIDEFDYLKSTGWTMVYITRQGAPVETEYSQHTSETQLSSALPWDHIITNDGTMKEFASAIRSVL